jgi:hypothetical protein
LTTTEFVQAIIEHVWFAPVPPAIWYLQRTRTLRTVATVVRGEVRDRWLRAKGVPAGERRKLAVDAVRRDLESS